MRIQPKYIQILGDAVIPLLGFFVWNWNIYFILLFYLLDLLVKEVVIHFKSNRIVKFKAEIGLKNTSSKNELKFRFLSSILLIFILFVIYFALIVKDNKFNLLKELIDFWNYKDMGFAQGYLLIPLLIVMGFVQYKNEFILPKLYENQTLDFIWKKHIKALIVLLSFSSLTFGILQFVKINDLILVISVIGISSAYQFLEIRSQFLKK
jgi:hypothetical protein